MELSQTYFVNPESKPSSNIFYFKSDPTMVTMIYPIREPMETIGSSSETSTNPSETISSSKVNSETGSSLLFSEGETLAINDTIPIQSIGSPKASTIPVALTETETVTTISSNESETTTNTLESETDSIVFSNESSLLFNESETITNFGNLSETVTLAVGNEIETVGTEVGNEHETV